jgi:hypothetical protein
MSAVLARAMKRFAVESVLATQNPLDVLAQQLVALVSLEQCPQGGAEKKEPTIGNRGRLTEGQKPSWL